MVKKEKFGKYEKYTIEAGALRAEAITLGAAIKSLRYKGRETVLGYERPEAYAQDGACLCAAVGRYANRIGGARFRLDGREYALAANEGPNQLHGGPNSLHKRIWQAEPLGEDSLRFSIFSPDGDNGFPGNLSMAVTYSVSGGSLRIDFEGESDMDTVFAPTSHLYFNLDGSESVLDTELMINAGGVLEVDGALIPTGKILPAEGRFDFSGMRKIQEDYDNCFPLASKAALPHSRRGTEHGAGNRFSRRADLHRGFPGRAFRKEPGACHRAGVLSDSPNTGVSLHGFEKRTSAFINTPCTASRDEGRPIKAFFRRRSLCGGARPARRLSPADKSTHWTEFPPNACFYPAYESRLFA